MKNDFQKALDFVFKHEVEFEKGHYGDMDFVVSENVAGDAGGLTKYGIDQRSHPTVNIESLSEEEAIEIYQKEYWEKYHCDKLEWPLCAVVFDCAVNMGGGMAIKLLQRACKVNDDGVWGPNTQGAVICACKIRGAEAVALELCDKRDKFYIELANKKPVLAKFQQGWLNRVEDLRKTIV